MRDGVGASRIAVSGGPWRSVADFLFARLPAGGDWHERLVHGLVLDREGRPLEADSPCRDGAVYWYWRHLPPEPRVPFEVDLLHHDEHLVVVDKPHFLPVTPGGRYLQETVLVRLKRMLGIDTLVPVHRLDLETAGVLMFTVQPGSRHAYQSLFRERQVHKVYEAVAPWRDGLALPATVRTRIEPGEGGRFMQMQTLPGEPNAETHVELIARLGDGGTGDGPRPLAHYRLTPLTGRKHQLRAHLCSLGIPIEGDRIYPVLWPAAPVDASPDYRAPLQLLARSVAFTDPLSGRPRAFSSRRDLALALRGATGTPVGAPPGMCA